MNKTFLTIALAAASMPLMFAKTQVPPAANNGAVKPAVTTPSKKHSRKTVTKKTAPKVVQAPSK